METIIGNLLDIDTGILAQVVNNRRIMGAGLAKQIAKKWPLVLQDYKTYQPWLGDCRRVWVGSDTKLAVANLYAQNGISPYLRVLHYGHLANALVRLDNEAAEYQLPVYIPWHMGCGLAHGDWEIVLELIEVFCDEAIIVQRKEDA